MPTTAKSVASRIKSDLKDRPLYPLLLLATACLFLSFQLGILLLPPTLVNVGDESDQAYVSNFHQRERNEWSSFRWTKARSYVTLADAGHVPVTVTLTLNGWRPEGQAAPEVVLLANGRELGGFAAQPQMSTYQFRYVPPMLSLEKDLVLEIRSDTFAPPSDKAGRTLGVLLDAVEFTPIVRPVWSSHLLLMALLSLATGLLYLLVRLLGATGWPSFVGALVFLALICLVGVSYPLNTYAIATLSFVSCSAAYGSLLVSDRLRRSIARLPARAVAAYRSLARSLPLSSQVAGLAVLGALCVNLATSVPAMIEDAAHVANHPFLSYGEKMRQRWGEFYDHITFVRDNTPPEARIAYVPWAGGSWRPDPKRMARVSLMQYFLYPRHVLTLADDQGKGEFTHAWMVRTRSYADETGVESWPQLYLPVKSVTYIPQSRQVWVDDFVLQQGSRSVVLEDFEDSTHFGEWVSRAQRVISETAVVGIPADREACSEAHDSSAHDVNRLLYLDLAYTQSDYDYWGKPVNVPLDEPASIKALVCTDVGHRVNIVAEVQFADGHAAVFGSPANQTVDSWQTLGIDNVFERAQELGLFRGWDVREMKITMIGVNPGHPAPMPYMEGWGVLEIAGSADETVLRVEPEVENGPYHFAVGQAYEGAGKMAEATAEYRQAILLEPGDARFHLALGEVLRAQREVEGAMAAYEQVIAMAPEVAWPHFALGELYLQAGQQEAALTEYERALAISPSLSEARFALASLHEARGELREAHEQFEVLSRFLYDPFHQAALHALYRIEEQW